MEIDINIKKVIYKLCKTFTNHTWGADKKTLLNIYKTLILSQINYGSPIYNTAKPWYLKTLDPIHREGIHLSIGAFRTSPTESILCYVGEIPLQLIRDKITLLHCIKRKTTPNHIGQIYSPFQEQKLKYQPQCHKKIHNNTGYLLQLMQWC